MRQQVRIGVVALIAALFISSNGFGQIVDTGDGNPNPTGGYFLYYNDVNDYQSVGMLFTLDDPVDIDQIDVWADGFGTFTLRLHEDFFGAPGAVVEETSLDISAFDPQWNAATDLGWSVDAGEYWVTVEGQPGQGNATIPIGVPDPLPASAFYYTGNGFWIHNDPGDDFGLRVWGPGGSGDVINVPVDFPTIQSAMFNAFEGDTVLVAPGTYNEAINFNGQSITVKSSGGPEVTTIDATGLNQPVVRVPNGSGAGTRLEGFTITGGDHTGGLAQGGGVSVDAFGGSTFITVADCIITGNVAESGGGAAVVFNGEAVFEDCTFHDNDTDGPFGGGGGLYANTGTAMLDGCTFTSNHATSGGGAVNVNNNGTVVATDCMFVSNTSDNAGGAVIVISSTADADFTGCTFDDNEAAQGGAVMVNGTSTDFINCNFVNNVATFAGSTAGGGLQVQGAATVTINGCEFEDNNAHLGGGVQFISLTGSASITGSSFRNNSAGLNGGGVQVLGGNPPSIGTTYFCGNAPNDISGTFTNAGGNTFDGVCTPDNDTPDNPEPVEPGEPVMGSFEGASSSGTSSCDPGSVDLFFAFTISNGPVDIAIDTCGSDADTALAVFDDDEIELACSTSCGGPGSPCTSSAACLVLDDLANGTYLIRVSLEGAPGNVAGASLDFVLNINEVELAIPGDLNNDTIVDEQDRALLCAAMGTSTGHPNFIEAADFDENGTIDQLDQIAFNTLLPPCGGDIVSSATFAPPADGVVDAADLAYLLGAWGAQPSCADAVTSRTFAPPPDGKVDGADLAYLLGAWGPCK
jgi:hypothetical protein